ncbi:hypothetical protein [Flavobacterium sp. 2]|uniref:hypothetical protein n=1 Tax=Flavobacterium sp. 2 TaxID=308053 RepID=UPI003CEEF343
MKNLILCSVLLCLLSACSSESDFEPAESFNKNSAEITKDSVFPLSPTNPFDAKGRKYYDIVQSYSNLYNRPNSIEEIRRQISFLAQQYKRNDNHKSANLGYTTEEIAAILDNPSVMLLEIVENCPISAASKSELLLFVQTLIAEQDEEYVTIRDYIISFDAGIIANTTLLVDEKETILTVSTISSYALYAEAERKDRDWETSVGTRHAKIFFNNNQAPIITIIALLNIVVKQ